MDTQFIFDAGGIEFPYIMYTNFMLERITALP
jgi:hypothetical protein